MAWEDTEFHEVVRTVELHDAAVYRIEIRRSVTLAEIRGTAPTRASHYDARYYKREIAHVPHEGGGEARRWAWVTLDGTGDVQEESADLALQRALVQLGLEIRRLETRRGNVTES